MIKTSARINTNAPSVWDDTPTIADLMKVRHEIIRQMTSPEAFNLEEAVRLAGLLENGGWDRGYTAGRPQTDGV